jgi:N-methylhydantoinase A
LSGIRVGIDVGGTFTKAVAVEPRPFRLRARATVATTHGARDGVTAGVVHVLRRLLVDLAQERARVEVVAFSTTQAMNALLEGDVARVGVIGIGSAPDLKVARKRTRVGAVDLAPGRSLVTEHEFLDATRGLSDAVVDEVLDRLEQAGCTAIAVSGSFAVDAPEHELVVVERARARSLPACSGHELTGTYGLETRTVSAAVNASILPVIERTAGLVERALAEAGLDAPLLVLRGDGGAMSVDAFRRRPSFTVGSGPAAGVAAALHQLGVGDAVVVECGGTSSNVSVVKRGRPVLRSIKVMGRPTSIRSIDSWVVGAAGGSMARLARRGIAEVGPRSAHVGGLPYASFNPPDAFRDAELELFAPRVGDPEAYAVISAGGRRYALTATCAANALALVPENAHAFGSREAAQAAFAPLARRLGTTAEAAARSVLDGAVRKIADAVVEATRAHDLGHDLPIVALGGAGQALAGEVARAVGRPLVCPEHADVLSSIGAALSLVRAEVARTVAGETAALELARDAERSCIAAGAAPATVAVETSYDPREGALRAVATGAVALETGAAQRERADEAEQRAAAASALGMDRQELSLVAATEYYRVYSENGSGRVAVVDVLGAVPLADNARRILAGDGSGLLHALRGALAASTLHLGVATLVPRVALISGPHILDFSDARRPEEIVRAAERALDGREGTAVAVLSR